MKVLAFFLLLSVLLCWWHLAKRPARKAAKKAVLPFVVPVLLAAMATLALLVFAFTFNGKLI